VADPINLCGVTKSIRGAAKVHEKANQRPHYPSAKTCPYNGDLTREKRGQSQGRTMSSTTAAKKFQPELQPGEDSPKAPTPREYPS